MVTDTTHPPATAERALVDLETIRATARRLLVADAEPPMPGELGTLTLQLRGHIMLVIPEVETAAERLPKDDVPRACPLACVGEARIRLSLEPGDDLDDAVAVAHELGMSGPGWTVWAHREHADLVEPDADAVRILARVHITRAL